MDSFNQYSILLLPVDRGQIPVQIRPKRSFEPRDDTVIARVSEAKRGVKPPG